VGDGRAGAAAMIVIGRRKDRLWLRRHPSILKAIPDSRQCIGLPGVAKT
jgi:hypothetical protein